MGVLYEVRPIDGGEGPVWFQRRRVVRDPGRLCAGLGTSRYSGGVGVPSLYCPSGGRGRRRTWHLRDVGASCRTGGSWRLHGSGWSRFTPRHRPTSDLLSPDLLHRLYFVQFPSWRGRAGWVGVGRIEGGWASCLGLPRVKQRR